MKKLILAIFAFSCICSAQQINPATQINWPLIAKAGTPTDTGTICASTNIGQPYQNTAVTPNDRYYCAASGWELYGGGNLSGTLTPGYIPVATGAHAQANSTVDQDITTPGAVTVTGKGLLVNAQAGTEEVQFVTGTGSGAPTIYAQTPGDVETTVQGTGSKLIERAISTSGAGGNITLAASQYDSSASASGQIINSITSQGPVSGEYDISITSASGVGSGNYTFGSTGSGNDSNNYIVGLFGGQSGTTNSGNFEFNSSQDSTARADGSNMFAINVNGEYTSNTQGGTSILDNSSYGIQIGENGAGALTISAPNATLNASGNFTATGAISAPVVTVTGTNTAIGSTGVTYPDSTVQASAAQPATECPNVICNGVADDTSALQACAASGGKHWLPVGYCELNGTMTFSHSGDEIYGSGAWGQISSNYATWIVQNSTTSNTILNNSGNGVALEPALHIHDLNITTPNPFSITAGSGNTSGIAIYVTGTNASSNGDGLIIERVYILGHAQALYTDGIGQAHVQDFQVSAAATSLGQYMVDIGSGSTNSWAIGPHAIIGCHIQGSSSSFALGAVRRRDGIGGLDILGDMWSGCTGPAVKNGIDAGVSLANLTSVTVNGTSATYAYTLTGSTPFRLKQGIAITGMTNSVNNLATASIIGLSSSSFTVVNASALAESGSSGLAATILDSSSSTIVLQNTESALGPLANGSANSQQNVTYMGQQGTYSNTTSSPFTTNGLMELHTTPLMAGTMLSAPTTTTLTTSTTGGILADATNYCYRISAVNANGSTPPSPETCITTGSGGGLNKVTIPWGNVSGATSYHVYGRTTATEALIASGVTGTSYTDTGSVTPSGFMNFNNTTAFPLVTKMNVGNVRVYGVPSYNSASFGLNTTEQDNNGEQFFAYEGCNTVGDNAIPVPSEFLRHFCIKVAGRSMIADDQELHYWRDKYGVYHSTDIDHAVSLNNTSDLTFAPATAATATTFGVRSPRIYLYGNGYTTGGSSVNTGAYFQLGVANTQQSPVDTLSFVPVSSGGLTPSYILDVSGFTSAIFPSMTDSAMTTAGYVTNTASGAFNSVASIPYSAITGGPPTVTRGWATLTNGTTTVNTVAACTPSTTCTYHLTNCGLNSSTAIGVPSVGTIVSGSYFVINSYTALAAIAMDSSNVCWQIN